MCFNATKLQRVRSRIRREVFAIQYYLLKNVGAGNGNTDRTSNLIRASPERSEGGGDLDERALASECPAERY